MSGPDLAHALLLMQACNAAYELDEAARSILLTEAALVEDAYVTGINDARALLCHTSDDSARILAFQGTQFTAGEIPSIMENIKAWPVQLEDGKQVDSGYWDQVRSILKALPPLPPLTDITGHSMGGCVAELFSGAGFAAGALTTFGAPKCANDVFWKGAPIPVVRFVHARDFAPVWPYFPDEWEQPGDQWWLHDGICEENLHRPVMPDSVPDHMPDTYLTALRAALAQPPSGQTTP